MEITKLVEYATNAREKAIENAAKREVANGMKQFRAFLDKVMQTAGNGVLGTIGSIASTTWSHGHAARRGARLRRPDDSGVRLDAHHQSRHGQRRFSPIRSSAQTITVDAMPGGTAANDVIVHDGLTGAQPVSLFGIKYHQNNATTGTWLNLNRATYPQQLPRRASTPATPRSCPAHVRLAINKVRKALGINQLGKLIAYTWLEQEHAWENLGITVSQIIKEGGAGSANDLDLLFSGRKTMSGVPIKSSVNADQTRVDFLDLSHWGRAVMKDIDFFEWAARPCSRFTAPAAASPRRSSSTSTPDSRCGTTRRAAARSSTPWPSPPATSCLRSGRLQAGAFRRVPLRENAGLKAAATKPSPIFLVGVRRGGPGADA